MADLIVSDKIISAISIIVECEGVKRMEKCQEEIEVKAARAKIVFEGTDECKKNIQELKVYIQSLNECIQEANNSIDRLAENMNRFGPSFKKNGKLF